MSNSYKLTKSGNTITITPGPYYMSISEPISGHNAADVVIVNTGKYGSSSMYLQHLQDYTGANRIVVNGSDSNDWITASSARDIITGGKGIDQVSYYNSKSGVSIYMHDDGRGYGGLAQGDVLKGIERIVGSNYNDWITGGAEDNFFQGHNGNDVLVGGRGDDALSGGAGVDILDGGTGSDTIYASSEVGVNSTINLVTGRGYGGENQGDRYYSMENVILYGNIGDKDTIIGNWKDNRLQAGDGDDRVEGGAGNDIIIGGNGSNTLIGGSGADVFAYGMWPSTHMKQDRILDFQDGVDKIDVSDYFRHRENPGMNLVTVTANGNDAVIDLTPNRDGGIIIVEDAAGKIDAGDFIF